MKKKLLLFVSILLAVSRAAAESPAATSFIEVLKNIPVKGYEFGWWTPISAAPSVLGWRFALDLDDFPSSLEEGLHQAAPVRVANYVAGARRVSLSVPRELGPSLYAGELRALPRINAAIYRGSFPVVPSIVAYRVHSLAPDRASLRQLFEFARTVDVETIIADTPPADWANVDLLASTYGIQVAVCGSYSSLVNALQHVGAKVGACLDAASLSGTTAELDQAIRALGQRVMVVEIGTVEAARRPLLERLLNDLYQQGIRPSLFIARAPAGSAATVVRDLGLTLDQIDVALRPVIAAQAARMSHDRSMGNTGEKAEQQAQLALYTGNSTRWDAATPDRQRAVDSALPKRTLVAPHKPRKLLVLDLNVGYPGHKSIPTHNYALLKLGQTTGAYQAIFDNNLDNLKYPAIEQYDAIFLNNTVGLFLEDPEVRAGLLRFVRQGGGLGGIHASVHAAIDWPEFAQLLGAAAGEHQQPTEKVWLKVDDSKSALTRAFKAGSFLYQDEIFRFTELPYSRESLHILLTVDVNRTDLNQTDNWADTDADALGRADSDYAVAWIHQYGQGRVFYTTLGHNPTLFTTPETAAFMLGAIQYILGDLPADATPSATLSKRQHAEPKGASR